VLAELGGSAVRAEHEYLRLVVRIEHAADVRAPAARRAVTEDAALDAAEPGFGR
jgi:hypothetical protein